MLRLLTLDAPSCSGGDSEIIRWKIQSQGRKVVPQEVRLVDNIR